jgi:hypothetical protein
MGIDGKPKDAEPLVQFKLPDGRAPLGRAAFEAFGALDIVDEHVNAAMVPSDALCQILHPVGVEVIDGDHDPRAAEL